MSRFTGNYQSNAIVAWTVTIGGLLLALYIGKQVAGQNFKLLAMIFGGAFAVGTILAMGKYYWLLIPGLGAFSGSISMLPVPFSYAELGTIGAIGIFVVYVSLKRINFGYHTNYLDLIVFVNIAWLIVVYARNPIGFRFGGADIIGGRSYINILMAFGAYFVLCHTRVTAGMAGKLPYIVAIPGVISGSIMVVTQYFPFLGRIIYPFYTGVSIAGMASFDIVGEEAGRITGMADIGKSLGLLLCAVYTPVTLVLPTHPIRCMLFLGSWIMVLISGFRSVFVSLAATVAISTMLRRRWSDLWGLAAAGLLALVIFVAFQGSGVSLPYSFQRALSFIPFVDWDQTAVKAADDSAQWRFEMWREAWSTDRYIKDKLLGDGFGFSIADFNAVMQQQLGTGEGFIGGSLQEAWLVRGSFHSGPLSTIRVVGILGLILYTISMVYMAYFAATTVQKTRGSPFFVWAMFVAIPVVYLPFEFIVIFGAFNTGMPVMILTTGYLKMLTLSFDKWKRDSQAAEQKAATPLAPGTADA